MSGHEGHDVAVLRMVRLGGTVGRLVCLDCDSVGGPLAFCGRPTKRGHALPNGRVRRPGAPRVLVARREDGVPVRLLAAADRPSSRLPERRETCEAALGSDSLAPLEPRP